MRLSAPRVEAPAAARTARFSEIHQSSLLVTSQVPPLAPWRSSSAATPPLPRQTVISDNHMSRFWWGDQRGLRPIKPATPSRRHRKPAIGMSSKMKSPPRVMPSWCRRPRNSVPQTRWTCHCRRSSGNETEAEPLDMPTTTPSKWTAWWRSVSAPLATQEKRSNEQRRRATSEAKWPTAPQAYVACNAREAKR